MKRYLKLTLVVAAVVLMGTYEASASGPRHRGGGPAHGGAAARGPAVRGSAVRNPSMHAPAAGVRRHAAGPAVRVHRPNRAAAVRRGVVNNPAVRVRGNQVRRHLGLPAAGALATTRHPWNRRAAYIRGNMRGRYNHLFTPGWYARHPYAWRPHRPHPGFWTAVVGWPVLANWIGIGAAYPYDYGMLYGGGPYYGGDTYYITDEGVPTDNVTDENLAEEYPLVDQDPEVAAALAAQGYTDDPNATTEQGEWLPLGVYTITSPNTSTTPYRVFQFSVNKNGILRGTYYDALSDHAVPLQGAINKETQRAAWTIGKNKQTVMETNIGSFVEDHATVIVHQGKDKTEKLMMVRLESPKTNQTNSTTPSTETITTPSTNTNTNPANPVTPTNTK